MKCPNCDKETMFIYDLRDGSKACPACVNKKGDKNGTTSN